MIDREFRDSYKAPERYRIFKKQRAVGDWNGDYEEFWEEWEMPH
jgi:hypothetical protein